MFSSGRLPEVRFCSLSSLTSTDTEVSWLEQVQRNAARFVCNTYNNYNVSSSELVLFLGWEALGVRRLYNQTVLSYKFYNGQFHVRFLTVYLVWVILHLFDATFTVYNNFSYSFFPRCIRMRNLLPSQVVSATSLNCFKAASGSQKFKKFEVNQRIFIDCNLTAAPQLHHQGK